MRIAVVVRAFCKSLKIHVYTIVDFCCDRLESAQPLHGPSPSTNDVVFHANRSCLVYSCWNCWNGATSVIITSHNTRTHTNIHPRVTQWREQIKFSFQFHFLSAHSFGANGEKTDTPANVKHFHRLFGESCRPSCLHCRMIITVYISVRTKINKRKQKFCEIVFSLFIRRAVDKHLTHSSLSLRIIQLTCFLGFGACFASFFQCFLSHS